MTSRWSYVRAGTCHVTASSLGAAASARLPRPPGPLRACAAAGLYPRVARHHRGRPTAVLPRTPAASSVSSGSAVLNGSGRQRQAAAQAEQQLSSDGRLEALFVQHVPEEQEGQQKQHGAPGGDGGAAANGGGNAIRSNSSASNSTTASSHNGCGSHNGGAAPRRSCTTSVHGGERGGRPKVADALTTPIVQTSTYTFANTAELIAYQEGRYGSFEYGRYGNPTTRACEEKIAALEGAEDCLVSASGMNSATTMLLGLVPAGGRIVTTTDCYRRTRQFIQTFLPKMGVTTTVVHPADTGALEAALEDGDVTLYFSESPTNPYLRCIDIPRVAALCHAAGALVCIDSTFATPCNQRALDLGADLVIHSGTKYLAGHNDVLAGAIAGSAQLVATVRRMHAVLGGVIDPHAAYLLLRGMKTLDLRVARQNATALELARRLEAHPQVLRVHYPGLASHDDHAIAAAQMRGCGGVVSFEVAGDLWKTAEFVDAVRLPYIAASLGGVETLIEQPTVISYWDQGPEKRAKYGIKDNLVRFSCGIESVEDIWADVEQALHSIA